jgi:hypothetical protein
MMRWLVIATCILLFPLTARAQTAPRPPNSTFASLSQSVYTSTQYFDDAGVRQPNGCDYQKNATTLYVEHGFSLKNVGSVQFEYDHLTCGGAVTNGLYDIEFAWLHELTHGATTHFSWLAQLLVPTGYNIGANPRIGYGRLGAQFGYVYAGNFKSWGSGYGFYAISAGLRGYFGYPAPQLRTFSTIGADMTPALQLIAEVEWDEALGAGHTLENIGENPQIFPAYSDGQAYVLVRIRLNPHLSLVGSTSGVFYGRDYGIGPTNAISIWGDF